MLDSKIIKAKNGQVLALERVKAKALKKENICIVFFIFNDSVWKYDKLYQLLVNDNRFDPIILVCPNTAHGEESMKFYMNKTFQTFKSKNYNVLLSCEEGKCIDVKKELQPDIIFFSNPHNISYPEFLVDNFYDYLTCYVPYGFKNSNLYEAHFNKEMQNLVWKFFLETDIHLSLSKKISRNKGVNAVVTGFPGLDIMLETNYQPMDVWKKTDTKKKRIIWAPHHTIEGYGVMLNYSNFMKYSDFMFEVAEKYKNDIQIAFKPHGLLRAKLSKPDVWGEVKTNDYYDRWRNLENGQLNESEYIDLFLTSDGMIHDSSSFVIEYLYTGKPVMFTINSHEVLDKFNEIGKKAISVLYQGFQKQDIERFIKSVIMDNNDIMKVQRNRCFEEIVKPPNGLLASENIYNNICSHIFTPTI